MKTRSAWTYRRVDVGFFAVYEPNGFVAIEMWCQTPGDQFHSIQHATDCWLRVQELCDDSQEGVFGYTMHSSTGVDYMPTFHTTHPVDHREHGVDAMMNCPMSGFIIVPPRTTTEDYVRSFLFNGGQPLSVNPAPDQNSVQS